MKMVVTLKSGAQIRVGVKEFTVSTGRLSSELRALNWTHDDDPLGTSLNWIDMAEVAAVHAEREPGDKPSGDAEMAASTEQQ
jgi:hypothetical protein